MVKTASLWPRGIELLPIGVAAHRVAALFVEDLKIKHQQNHGKKSSPAV